MSPPPAPATGRAGRLGRPGQRLRGRVPVGVAGGLATHRPDGRAVLRARLAPYARLAPGDHVRFVARGRSPNSEAAAAPPPAADPRPPERPRPRVRGDRARAAHGAPGSGRVGMAAIGVPAAGPADPVPLSWPIAWWAIRPTPPRSRSPPRDRPCAASARRSWRWSGPDPSSGWGASRCRRPGRAAGTGPGSRVGMVRGGLRAIWRWPGASWARGPGEPLQRSPVRPRPGPDRRRGPPRRRRPPPTTRGPCRPGARTARHGGRGHPAGGAGPAPRAIRPGRLRHDGSANFTVGAESNRVGLRLRARGPAPLRPPGPWPSSIPKAP